MREWVKSAAIAAAVLLCIGAFVVLAVATRGVSLAVSAVLLAGLILTWLVWSVLYDDCHCSCAYCPYRSCPKHGTGEKW